MPRYSATPFAFPEFRGATRSLVLWNLCAYFALLLMQFASSATALEYANALAFIPSAFLHGLLWQPLTYSLIHLSLLATLFELLSLWFLAGLLESTHSAGWITGLYIISVLGTAAAATVIYVCGGTLGLSTAEIPITGCIGGIFGLLVAIGVLFGDAQFLLFFVIGIKARYLVVIYALIAIAMLFGQQRMYAFAQLGGAIAGLLYLRLAPRTGFRFALSEGWYGLRNSYYRRKRRRAARKFEVYMRKHGQNVHLDGYGHPIDDKSDDKKRWN